MERPSHRELSGKLKDARVAAEEGHIAFVEPEPIYADLLELDFLIDELAEALPSIIGEITPDHYQGKRPPERSYESKISGRDLFAFKWLSRTFGCTIYFKFTLKDENLWIVSLHRDRSTKGG